MKSDIYMIFAFFLQKFVTNSLQIRHFFKVLRHPIFYMFFHSFKL